MNISEDSIAKFTKFSSSLIFSTFQVYLVQQVSLCLNYTCCSVFMAGDSYSNWSCQCNGSEYCTR